MTTRLFCILIATLFSSTLLAAGKATIQVSTTKDKEMVKVTFKAVPSDGLVINAEGPWKLEVSPTAILTTDKTEWKRADWNQELPGFEIIGHAKGKESSGEISYKMITFVCTKDKTQCYREVISDKAKISW